VTRSKIYTPLGGNLEENGTSNGPVLFHLKEWYLMKAIMEYRCRLCGDVFRVGDPVVVIKDDNKLSNVAIDVPRSEIVITGPEKEIRMPLVRYHICDDPNSIGIADFAGFIQVG